MRVADIMTGDVVTVKLDTSVSQVAELMFDQSLSGLPVLDEQNQLAGIITEHDLLSRKDNIHIPSYMKLLEQLKTAGSKSTLKSEINQVQSLKARDIMTKPVVTIAATADIAEAASVFIEENVNPLPVVDAGGNLVGIVARADLIKLLKKVRVDQT